MYSKSMSKRDGVPEAANELAPDLPGDIFVFFVWFDDSIALATPRGKGLLLAGV